MVDKEKAMNEAMEYAKHVNAPDNILQWAEMPTSEIAC
jgi:hypothetical protein